MTIATSAARNPELVYKVVTLPEWRQAEPAGRYEGSDADQADGFIHFSSAEQLAGTLEKHFACREDLLLLAIAAADLGPELRWEPSRGGALFPHLYGSLDLRHVRARRPLPVNENGRHLLDDL